MANKLEEFIQNQTERPRTIRREDILIFQEIRKYWGNIQYKNPITKWYERYPDWDTRKILLKDNRTERELNT